MTYCEAIGVDVNPKVAVAIEALRWHLLESYAPVTVDPVCRHVAATGTLAGAPYIEAEDEATAEAVFVAALEPTGEPYGPSDDDWDDYWTTYDRDCECMYGYE